MLVASAALLSNWPISDGLPPTYWKEWLRRAGQPSEGYSMMKPCAWLQKALRDRRSTVKLKIRLFINSLADNKYSKSYQQAIVIKAILWIYKQLHTYRWILTTHQSTIEIASLW